MTTEIGVYWRKIGLVLSLSLCGVLLLLLLLLTNRRFCFGKKKSPSNSNQRRLFSPFFFSTNVILLLDNIQPPWWIFIQFFSSSSTTPPPPGLTRGWRRGTGETARVSRQHSNRPERKKKKKKKEIKREKEVAPGASSFQNATTRIFSSRAFAYKNGAAGFLPRLAPISLSHVAGPSELIRPTQRRRTPYLFYFSFFFFCIFH